MTPMARRRDVRRAEFVAALTAAAVALAGLAGFLTNNLPNGAIP